MSEEQPMWERDLCLPPSPQSYSCINCGVDLCTDGVAIVQWRDSKPLPWDGNFFCCPACLKESAWLTK